MCTTYQVGVIAYSFYVCVNIYVCVFMYACDKHIYKILHFLHPLFWMRALRNKGYDVTHRQRQQLGFVFFFFKLK